MKLRYIPVAILVLMVLKAIAGYESAIVKQVKSGEVALVCHLPQGEVQISPELVVDFFPDQGYWEFTNGGAKSCRIINP